MSTKYALVSLPLGIFDSSDKEEAVASLSATILPENGNVRPFNIPDFKIGTLDALVQQADDLAKLESTCAAVVAKVADSLKLILDGDKTKSPNRRWSMISPPINTLALSPGIESDTAPTSL